MRVLFVTNGHGEAAIAACIARNLRDLAPAQTHHLALVGAGFGDAAFLDVGPQRAMPSGGLVAMGNVAAFSRDLRAGFLRLLARQMLFLRGVRAAYDCVVAVGDVYALLLANLAALPTIYVGTAKSVYVVPYAAIERAVLRGARAIFVRDTATALDLQAHGVDARAPGNVIVDLLDEGAGSIAWSAPLRLVLLPGSREAAYADGRLLAAVARRVAELHAGVEAAMSLAPGLDATRFAAGLRADGWTLDDGVDPTPFRARTPMLLQAYRGELGPLLATATVAIGQAGTANEAAAACGLPVVALETSTASRTGWYRMRQAKMLGDSLAIVPGDVETAARAIVALLEDPVRRRAMGAVGRERMGGAGGSRAIAEAIALIAQRAE